MKWFAIALLVVTGLTTGLAQEAPTGAHYAGRASDTGHGGTHVSATGTFPVSVSLNLPAARGGLPVPLSVVYSARGIGAAGLGWDIPLSYIKRDKTFAHRRPSSDANKPLSARQRVTISLFGENYDLLPRGDMWVASTGTLQLAVRQDGPFWLVYDGSGRTYRFSEPQHLVGSGFWLLTSVTAMGGAVVEISYSTNIIQLEGGGGFEINLSRIVYNKHPTSWCFKNEIVLTYAQLSAPAALSVLGDKIMTRRSGIDRIEVMSRATCGAAPEGLRAYRFVYAPDADTKLPRLIEVRLFGRQNTPEANRSLPIVSYQYGSATRDGKLAYQKTQLIQLPDGVDDSNISATTESSGVTAPGANVAYASWQSLVDMSGDGRPDFVFRKNGKLWMGLNRPESQGDTTLTSGPAVPMSDATFTGGTFSTHGSNSRRFKYYTVEDDPATTKEDPTGVRVTANHNVDNVWRQAIDVNGDGRLDIVDAAEKDYQWVVYLNTPSASGIKWERRSFSVRRLGHDLAKLGHRFDSDNSTDPKHVPLSRRSTSGNVTMMHCWRWDGDEWQWWTEGVTSGECRAIENPVQRQDERTLVEWELSDLNGDGYPDFVYNSKAVDFWMYRPLPRGSSAGEILVGMQTVPFGPHEDNEVRALFNVRGILFNENVDPFSGPVNLNVADPGSGVAIWQNRIEQGQTQERQVLMAGFADVNGDGLADRFVRGRSFPLRPFVENVAYLGVYADPRSMFSQVSITLPGRLASQFSERKTKCSTQTLFTVFQSQGLRDLTGDGIPDYYQSFPTRKVWIGTGAGFTAAPVNVEGNFVFSTQTERCDGKSSKTTRGLFDIDGDGKPESVHLAGHAIEIHQIVGRSGRGTPEAGRLTMIDNGYGAKTAITYISAKQDSSSSHQVPFAEIVVSSVETSGAYSLGGKLAGGRYAYGNAQLMYDSVSDRFVFPGYQRFVELIKPAESRLGSATVTDAWPLTEFDTSLTRRERWLRTKKVGKPRDIYKLRTSTPNPWSLLLVDSDDQKVVGVTHFEWDTNLYKLADWEGPEYWCLDLPKPYDYQLSVAYNFGSEGLNACRSHGFTFISLKQTWYGSKRPPSDQNVETRTRAIEIDYYGRVIRAEFEGDIHQGDDDVCIENNFAFPVNNSFPRVLNALASRRIKSCRGETTYASSSFAYDKLSPGFVSNGRVTSQTVENFATDTGERLPGVRKFDAQYDDAGNLTVIRTQREGVSRSIQFTYDPFGLVATNVKVEAANVPTIETSMFYDSMSLEQLSSTDANQTQRGTNFDGFGRPVSSTITPPGGQLGVLSTLSYEGFEGADPQGRRTVAKRFSQAVPRETVETAKGRLTTTFFDELGRPRRTEIALGSDYGNQTLVTGARIYDSLGRIYFEADPYPATHDPTTTYGTSYHFTTRGELECAIRGRGPQLLIKTTDYAVERFPTCFERSFSRFKDVLQMRDPRSLRPGSPDVGVATGFVFTGLGRVIERSTTNGSVRLDFATFSYDRLGQQTGMTRYLDPAGGSNPVEWSSRLNSLGEILELREPETATRTFTYSDWGELIETRWTDNQNDQRVVNKYDALGRLTFAAEVRNGVTDTDTIKEYSYDRGVNVSPHVTPANMVGRLARATSKGGQVAFSYDHFGRINARTFTDGQPGGIYVEKSQYSDDGNLAALEFNLPDQNYQPEITRYAYDSAGRLRKIDHSDSTGSRQLYEAQLLDPLGRVRKARYGDGATYVGFYADDGRRLMNGAYVASPHGSRSVLYGYDELGRELVRRETKDGGPATDTVSIYDSLGRLSGMFQRVGANTPDIWRFSYDALGNIVRLSDPNIMASAKLGYDGADPDRLCRVRYGIDGPVGSICNVRHDAVGNVVRQRIRNDAWRNLRYYASGSVRSISQPSVLARFSYDAFGDVQELDVVGPGTHDFRRDRRYGQLLERREVKLPDGSAASSLFRYVPGPGGSVASRRGPNNFWVFKFGEQRGNRFFTDQDGAFVQDVTYRPFGEAKSTGAPPKSVNYTSYQWNRRDALASLGLSHLGARLYDPVIGRFLSRDPIKTSRGAVTTNPYAFAMNDPVNLSDPSGLDPGDSSDEEVWDNVATGAASAAVRIADFVGTVWNLADPTPSAAILSFSSNFLGFARSGENMVLADEEHVSEMQGRFGVAAFKFVGGIGMFVWKKTPYGIAISVGSWLGMKHWEWREDARERSQTKIRDLMYPIKLEVQRVQREDRLSDLARSTVCVAAEPACREQATETSSMSAEDEEWYNSQDQWNSVFPMRAPPPSRQYIYPQPLNGLIGPGILTKYTGILIIDQDQGDERPTP